MLSSERKHFNLQPARIHKVTKGLSNLVVVDDAESTQICYIKFSDSFIISVGKLLPQGISQLTPASIFVDKEKDHWRVSVKYVIDFKKHTLWKSAHKPTWITNCKPLPRNDHEDQTQDHPNKGRERGSRTRAPETKRQ